jgi:hypothetical protein
MSFTYLIVKTEWAEILRRRSGALLRIIPATVNPFHPRTYWPGRFGMYGLLEKKSVGSSKDGSIAFKPSTQLCTTSCPKLY